MRSLALPVDALLRNSASRPMKVTASPSISLATRVDQASSNPTPEMDVSRSIRFGSFPSWITRPGSHQIVDANIQAAESKLADGLEYALGVRSAGMQKEIDVPRIAGESVPGNRKRTDD